jgi:hypothetical protein
MRAATRSSALEPAIAAPAPPLDALWRLRARVAGSERTGRVAMGAMVAASLALVLAAAGRRSTLSPPGKGGFPDWMVGPFKGLAPWLPSGRLAAPLAFSALLGAMLVAYLALVACERRLDRRWVLGSLALLHAVFLLGPPLALTDVFNYLDYARLGALHGINPYAEPPAAWPADPSYAFATWHHLTSPYGQLFTLGTYLLVPLGLPGSYWALKLATAAASAACLWLVWRLARARGRDPVAAVALVGLNPLVLVYALGGVHNDYFMLAAMLAGMAALEAGRPARAGGALVAAAAVKTSAALVAPFAFLASQGAGRTRLVLGGAAAGIAILALSLAAFGTHGPALDTQGTLVTPLSAPNLVGLALGQGGATEAVVVLSKLALVVVALALLRATWRGADWIASAGWATLALVLTLTWQMPWYVLWVAPLAVLADSRALRRATVGLTVFLAITLAPATGLFLADVCQCSPAQTETGERNAREIRLHLK